MYNVQSLVNAYHERNYANESDGLKKLWIELERSFGNPMITTNTFLDHLSQLASFSPKDRDRLQEFSDLCADIWWGFK